jgi:hypothetical protein
MALLRRVPFGQPVSPEHFVELGPARGRLSDGRGSLGGPLSEQENYWTKHARLKRERLAREREAAK